MTPGHLAMLALVFASLVLPLWLSIGLWRARERDRLGWLLRLSNAAAFLALVLVVGRWDITGYYTRFLLVAVLLAAAVASWRRHAELPLRAPTASAWWYRYGTETAVSALFLAILGWATAGYMTPDAAVSLRFPLRDGWFMVAHGGDNPLLNHHNGHRAQRFALDVTALNAAGVRARGLLPRDVERYAIWGRPVVSPCDGSVAAARDGLADLTPPQRDPQNPKGNHVSVRCGGVTVVLAHLRNGSVLVDAGEAIASGQRIGAVGNSGNTTEPHLNVHAVRSETGAGLPVLFDGRFPARNATFVR